MRRPRPSYKGLYLRVQADRRIALNMLAQAASVMSVHPSPSPTDQAFEAACHEFVKSQDKKWTAIEADLINAKGQT